VLRTIVDVLVAFSRGGLLRFGLRTLARGPSAVIAVLTVLLAIWTVVLALAPADPWFPHSLVKWGWVAFDIAMAAGLSALVYRPSRALVTALAAAATCDAVLTLWQAVAWNVPRSRGLVDDVIITAACAAPIVASIALWGARRTRLRYARSASPTA
jgi:phosphatidylglycerol lysyltransferase